jgi:hypothetical protein
MEIAGSCHCQAVRFRVHSRHPHPYMRCYCSICRKTGGGGGYLINLAADAKTLQVTGADHVRIYRAHIERDGQRERSSHERHFCAQCGSHLWAYDPHWPDLVHPVAGAVDTPLPTPPSHVHIMLASKAPWVEVEGQRGDPSFDAYPDQSIADWHDAHGLTEG